MARMSNSTPARLAIGLLALFPIAYFIFFAIKVSSFPSAVTASPDAFDHLFRIHIIAHAISILLIGSFVVYVFRTTRVPQPKKGIVGYGALVGGSIWDTGVLVDIMLDRQLGLHPGYRLPP